MKSIKIVSIAVSLFAATIVCSAQTVQDVAAALATGIELRATAISPTSALSDVDAAIAAFENCIELAEAVGDDAFEMQMTAESVLPELYFQRVARIPTNDFPAMLAALHTAVAVAEKFNDNRIRQNAERQIPQLYFAKGAEAFQARNYDEAIPLLEQAVARNPAFTQAYFVLGATFEAMQNEEKMIENYMLAIETGSRPGGDARNAQSARNQLRNHYFNAGLAARRAQRVDEAIPLFLKAVEVDNSHFDSLYALASSYNSLRRWDDAIEISERALQIENIRTCPFHFELGTAFAGRNDNVRACESFRRVTEAAFLESAQFQITNVLRCR